MTESKSTQEIATELIDEQRDRLSSAIAAQSLETVGTTSPSFDKASLILLGGTAATASLLISNMEGLLPLLGRGGFRTALFLLVISSLLGVSAKIRALKAQVSLQARRELGPALNKLLEEHDEKVKQLRNYYMRVGKPEDFDADEARIAQELTKMFPFWYRRSIRREFSSHDDDLKVPREIANHVFWQSAYLAAQVVFFLLFAFSVMWHI